MTITFCRVNSQELLTILFIQIAFAAFWSKTLLRLSITKFYFDKKSLFCSYFQHFIQHPVYCGMLSRQYAVCRMKN